jgi:hypothetical protein
MGLLLLASGCSQENSRVRTTLNQSAALEGVLPVNPLTWKILTSGIDRADATMWTLFGNDLAVESARSGAKQGYPVGATLALVTWTQQEDPRWFGGKIPAVPISVEFATVSAGPNAGLSYLYQEYTGTPLKQVASEQSQTPGPRMAHILSQRAAVLP